MAGEEVPVFLCGFCKKRVRDVPNLHELLVVAGKAQTGSFFGGQVEDILWRKILLPMRSVSAKDGIGQIFVYLCVLFHHRQKAKPLGIPAENLHLLT